MKQDAHSIDKYTLKYQSQTKTYLVAAKTEPLAEEEGEASALLPLFPLFPPFFGLGEYPKPKPPSGPPAPAPAANCWFRSKLTCCRAAIFVLVLLALGTPCKDDARPKAGPPSFSSLSIFAVDVEPRGSLYTDKYTCLCV